MTTKIKDDRTPEQRKADQRTKAIRTCCAKIIVQQPRLSDEEALEKATKWYEQKEKENQLKEHSLLSGIVLSENDWNDYQEARRQFKKSFVGPIPQQSARRNLLDLMSE